jgi:hypothetical protein
LSIFNSSKILGFFAGAITVSLLVAWLISETLAPAESPDTRLRGFYTASSDLEVVSLGNSHASGIHFPSLGMPGYSLFSNGMDIPTSVWKLRLAIPYTPKLRYVILPLVPSQLSHSSQGSDNNNALYNRLQNAPWPKVFFSSDLLSNLTIVRARIHGVAAYISHANTVFRERVTDLGYIHLSNKPRDTGFHDCIRRPNHQQTADEFGVRHGYKITPMPRKCMKWRSRKSVAGQVNAAKKSLIRNPNTRADNMQKLAHLVETLKHKNVHLILVIPPFWSAYFDSPDLQELWHIEEPLLRDLAARQNNVTFYDFHDLFADHEMLPKNTVYYDDNHLTLKGAQILSQEIRHCLNGDTPCKAQ